MDALDQLLEYLLDTGEENIVRMGGHSKSEKLERYQLSRLARDKAKLTNEDFRRLRRVDTKLHGHREEIEKLIERNKSELKWLEPNGGACTFLIYIYSKEEPSWSRLDITLRFDINSNFLRSITTT